MKSAEEQVRARKSWESQERENNSIKGGIVMRKLVVFSLLILFAVTIMFAGKGERIFAFPTYSNEVEGGMLLILDLTNPTAPKAVYELKTELASFPGIYVSGNYLYLTASNYSNNLIGHADFYVLNISDIENPTVEMIIEVPEQACKITQSGNYLYLANWNLGLSVVDVSVPSSPQLIKTLKIDQYEINQGIREVEVSGNYLYLGAMDHKTRGQKSGIHVVDISDPSDPLLVASYIDRSLLDGVYDIAIDGNKLYAGSVGGGIAVLDISNPLSPELIERKAKYLSVLGLVVGEYHVYAGCISKGIAVFSEEINSNVQYFREFSQLHIYWEFEILDDRLYAANDFAGVKILDISNEGNPILLGTFQTENFDVCDAIKTIKR